MHTRWLPWFILRSHSFIIYSSLHTFFEGVIKTELRDIQTAPLSRHTRKGKFVPALN
jgi:hypothetical protein